MKFDQKLQTIKERRHVRMTERILGSHSMKAIHEVLTNLPRQESCQGVLVN